MKILYLVPCDIYTSKMSRVRFDQVEAIGKQVPVVVSGPGLPGWDSAASAARNAERIVVGDGPADVVLAYQVSGLAGCAIPTLTSFNEAFDVSKVTRYVEENRLAGVVFHHENDLPRYPHLRAQGVLTAHVPHCASEAVYRDYELEKDIDILVAGNLNRDYYPFRVRLRDLAWRVLRKRGYRVVVLHHPGYVLPARPGSIVREDFARMMNRSKLVVTCSMRYRYALGKYSEIGLCRSLAMADCPDERPEHFAATTLALHPSMLDRDILDLAERVLDDPDELRQRTDRAWELTQRTSTMAHYAERFLAVAKAVADRGPRV